MKKKKTIAEKYWDWELANKTKPIWVENFYSSPYYLKSEVVQSDLIVVIYSYYYILYSVVYSMLEDSTVVCSIGVI